MSKALRAQVLTYLQEHNTLTVATEGPDGPWAAGLFYASDDFLIYWLSKGGSRHSRNIAYRPRVSIAIHEDYQDWRLIQGIQMEGMAELIGKPSQNAEVMSTYIAKFPFMAVGYTSRKLAGALVGALTRVQVYRFTPDLIFFVDNTRGLGHRRKLKPS